MINLSPRLLIATVTAFVGLGEDHGEQEDREGELAEHGTPQGLIDHLRRGVDADRAGAWDAALVHHCGFWSHFDHRSEHSTWPVIAAATANDLAEFGRTMDVLREEPLEGDIYLQYAPRIARFARAGVIAHVGGRRVTPTETPVFDVLSIEGNTGDHGELGGVRTLRVVRRLSPASGDRFLRWVDLEPRRARCDDRSALDAAWTRLARVARPGLQ